MKTIPEVSKDTLILQKYIHNNFKEGAELSFDKIAFDTKIKMDNLGKQRLRAAFRRNKFIYLSIHGYGVKYVEKNDTMPLLAHKLRKIDNTVKRADKTHKTLQAQFFSRLEPEVQKEILYLGAVFGAIRVAADSGKLVYAKTTKTMSDSTMHIPLPPR